MVAAVTQWVDPLVVMIISVLVLGLLLPASGRAADAVGTVTTAAVVLLFFLYGARMATREVWDGLRNLRLQGSMLTSTFVAFPVLGLALQLLPSSVLAPDLRLGMLYLTLLPSTVQSSIVFTSVARGNIAGAICGATISNMLGIVITPLLVGVLMNRSGGSASGGTGATLLQLLLPFVLGQIVQPWIGPWVRAHRGLTRVTDRATIVFVAYGSVSEATISHAWAGLTWVSLVVLLVVCAVLLAVMLTSTWTAGARLGLDRADRIALLMVGSKKSLATGLPMASVLFTPAMAASVALPVIMFHQLQLATCAVLARRLAPGAVVEDVVGSR
jgi:sodium/bile acid cotransporter 7